MLPLVAITIIIMIEEYNDVYTIVGKKYVNDINVLYYALRDKNIIIETQPWLPIRIIRTVKACLYQDHLYTKLALGNEFEFSKDFLLTHGELMLHSTNKGLMLQEVLTKIQLLHISRSQQPPPKIRINLDRSDYPTDIDDEDIKQIARDRITDNDDNEEEEDYVRRIDDENDIMN